MTAQVPATRRSNQLTNEPFQLLADVAPEIEWFANLGNDNTRRAYQAALDDFMSFTGIAKPKQFRTVTRAHVIAWRDDLVAQRSCGARTGWCDGAASPCGDFGAI